LSGCDFNQLFFQVSQGEGAFPETFPVLDPHPNRKIIPFSSFRDGRSRTSPKSKRMALRSYLNSIYRTGAPQGPFTRWEWKRGFIGAIIIQNNYY
jgi:hypothetical protein